jgi:hypothetical protein
MLQSKTARRLAVAAATTLVAACQDGTPSDPIAPSLERSARAQERLEAVFQRVSPDVMDLPGTVFADNDEAAGKVVIGVEHMGAARGVQNAMQRLGVAEQDYAVELAQPIQLASTLRDVFRPTVAGIQINFPGYLCTMGFNVDHAGGRSFITNSHCTSTQGGVESTPYWQPLQSVDGTQIATEVDDPVYRKNIAGCSRGKKCRYSDASRALYASNVVSTRGEIAQTTGANNGSLTVSSTSPVFTINAQDNITTRFKIGTTVNKVGRTTGWTRGNVTNTCVTTNVSGSTVQLLCQSFVSDPGGATVVSGGDSGSPVFTNSNSSATLVGILWGGSSDNKLFVFSPLKNIQDELGSFNAVR